MNYFLCNLYEKFAWTHRVQSGYRGDKRNHPIPPCNNNSHIFDKTAVVSHDEPLVSKWKKDISKFNII